MSAITFCINTARNELNHLKLLFKSLKENLSTIAHPIIVFVDSDNQGTFSWLLQQKSTFPNLTILKNELPVCYGYARNINEMFLQAKTDIVSYLQSDMVVCKNYDTELLSLIEPNTILCSTRIEPPLHGNSGEKITFDFGVDPEQFDLSGFTTYAEDIKTDKTTEYFFAPFTLYKDVWNKIGGHDTLFRRSREDSDILRRLVLNDTKIIQTWKALVYHFTCTSSRGHKWFDKSDQHAQQRALVQQQADTIELFRFLRKWGRFDHDVNKKQYFSASVVFTNCLPSHKQIVLVVEPYFSKVYVDSHDLLILLKDNFEQAHKPANNLLDFTDEEWKTYGYMYNQERFDDRFTLFAQQSDDVVLFIDPTKISKENFSIVSNLQDILAETNDIGSYEYGPYTIHINRLVDRAREKIKVTNPSIKQDHIYSIH